MARFTLENLDDADLTRHAIEVAHRVWWVGHVQKDDVFQCHVYLIEQGDQSVLVDPGSKLTFRHTLSKIEQVIPFSHIRYFICHHQDPDITGALTLIDQMVSRDDAVVVTHWRAQELLKHYALDLPFWLVDQNDWQLELDDRRLSFVFTPYAHFPGAFCSFDEHTRVLFSSDLFGGFTEKFSLVAADESYYESLRPFHEHYMPSRDILGFAVAQMQRHPVRMILPQHGSIIPEHLVDYMFAKLKELECGLYLMASESTDIHRLSRLNQTLKDITRTMMVTRDFGELATRLLEIARRMIPAELLEFYARTDDDEVLYFAPENRYRGRVGEVPARIAEILGLDHKSWLHSEHNGFKSMSLPRECGSEHCIVIPLFSPDAGQVQGVAVIRLLGADYADQDVAQVIDQMSVPLQIALKRESIYRSLDMERQHFFERAIRDPLTELFTRLYMQDAVGRLFALHDRNPEALVAVALIDIDHFKAVNDGYGHMQGDVVLKRIAASLKEAARETDIPVRLGGEEFAVFLAGNQARGVGSFAERLRRTVENLEFDAPLDGLVVSISVGTAMRVPGEEMNDFLGRADAALYRAKQAGRNRVCLAVD